jgi:hypothetical protein
MWDSFEGLLCGCGASYSSRGSKPLTLQGARARGWHILEEEAFRENATLCPECIKTPRPRLAKSAPMPDDQPLFDLEEQNDRHRTVDHN